MTILDEAMDATAKNIAGELDAAAIAQMADAHEQVATDLITGTVVPEMSTDPVPTPAPKTPPMITRKQWGEYLNKMFTVRNFAMPCGHKLLVQRNEKGEAYLPSDPKTNCHMCWFLYFQNNGNMTQIADQCFQEAGRDVLERSRGKKFVRYFLRFMATMARFQREQEEQNALQRNLENTTTEAARVLSTESTERSEEQRSVSATELGQDVPTSAPLAEGEPPKDAGVLPETKLQDNSSGVSGTEKETT